MSALIFLGEGSFSFMAPFALHSLPANGRILPTLGLSCNLNQASVKTLLFAQALPSIYCMVGQAWEDLTNRFVNGARAYEKEVSTEKSKLMTNSSTNNISADISMNGQKLEEVTSFKYLGATLCKDGTCSAGIRIRIVSAMTRLNRIWRSNIISFANKFTLYN